MLKQKDCAGSRPVNAEWQDGLKGKRKRSWWHLPLILAQAVRSVEFEAVLDYIVSSRTARAICRDPDLCPESKVNGTYPG